MREPEPGLRRIVLLDDDPGFADVVRDLLEAEGGHAVEVHATWQDAVEFVADRRPDLVILDILFGGEQQGLVALLELRSAPATWQIPVIICSADRVSLRSYAGLLASYGVPAIEKPVDLDELLRTIERELTRRDPEPDGG
jgi:two-component system, sensor histidine kinase ChiS